MDLKKAAHYLEQLFVIYNSLFVIRYSSFVTRH